MATQVRVWLGYPKESWHSADYSGKKHDRVVQAEVLRVRRAADRVVVGFKGERPLNECTLEMSTETAITVAGLLTAVAHGHRATVGASFLES